MTLKNAALFNVIDLFYLFASVFWMLRFCSFWMSTYEFKFNTARNKQALDDG